MARTDPTVTIKAYLSSLPVDRRPEVEKVREVVCGTCRPLRTSLSAR